MDTQIKSERINRRALIHKFIFPFLVAVLSGILIPIILRACNPVQQHWLVIHNVRNLRVGNEVGRYVRVVASVNGVNYAYPSQAVWATIGPQMCTERFPLPIKSSSYRVAFSAMVCPDPRAPVDELISQFLHEIRLSQIPTNQSVYGLYLIDKVNGTIEPKPTLEIYYAVVND
ncbi:MAG: hypothetical protein Q8O04_09955 [Deltaproteobacteria bacterium]|nr:hypothetical protein [Deltaproteobacteria bacterium]